MEIQYGSLAREAEKNRENMYFQMLGFMMQLLSVIHKILCGTQTASINPTGVFFTTAF